MHLPSHQTRRRAMIGQRVAQQPLQGFPVEQLQAVAGRHLHYDCRCRPSVAGRYHSNSPAFRLAAWWKMFPSNSACLICGDRPRASRSASISLINFKNIRLENSLNRSIPARSPSFRNKSFASAKISINSCLVWSTFVGVTRRGPSFANWRRSFGGNRSTTGSPSRKRDALDRRSNVWNKVPSDAKTMLMSRAAA